MRLLRWFWHWSRQGLKLLLFLFVGALVISPLQWPLDLLNEWQEGYVEPPVHVRGVVILVGIVCFLVSVSVFAAVVAAQLKNHPLCGPEPREETPDIAE